MGNRTIRATEGLVHVEDFRIWPDVDRDVVNAEGLDATISALCATPMNRATRPGSHVGGAGYLAGASPMHRLWNSCLPARGPSAIRSANVYPRFDSETRVHAFCRKYLRI